MKIQSVRCNNRKKAFQVKVSNGMLPFPYSKTEPRPSAKDPIVTVRVDRELGREGFTYVLESGKEGRSIANRCSNTIKIRITCGIPCYIS